MRFFNQSPIICEYSLVRRPSVLNAELLKLSIDTLFRIRVTSKISKLAYQFLQKQLAKRYGDKSNEVIQNTLMKDVQTYMEYHPIPIVFANEEIVDLFLMNYVSTSTHLKKAGTRRPPFVPLTDKVSLDEMRDDLVLNLAFKVKYLPIYCPWVQSSTYECALKNDSPFAHTFEEILYHPANFRVFTCKRSTCQKFRTRAIEIDAEKKLPIDEPSSSPKDHLCEKNHVPADTRSAIQSAKYNISDVLGFVLFRCILEQLLQHDEANDARSYRLTGMKPEDAVGHGFMMVNLTDFVSSLVPLSESDNIPDAVQKKVQFLQKRKVIYPLIPSLVKTVRESFIHLLFMRVTRNS